MPYCTNFNFLTVNYNWYSCIGRVLKELIFRQNISDQLAEIVEYANCISVNR